MHGIGVHYPGHRLLVGVHVGGGDVLLGPDEIEQLGGVAAGHALQLALRHFVRIADDAALGAAERNVHHRALPRHPARQRADFVEVHVGPVAQSALGRAARNGVLHAVSGEDFEVPVVHLHRDMNNNFAARTTQNLPQSFIKIQLMGGEVKAGGLRLPGISFLFEVHCLHKNLRMIAIVIASPNRRASLAKYIAGPQARQAKGEPKRIMYLQRAHSDV